MTPYDLGQAAVLLSRSAEKQAAATLSYGLRGRLVFSPSGYVLLEVPNDLGNGAFKALAEPSVEQPISKSRGTYNAHVSVMRPDEVESIGGPDKIKQRGHTFAFTLGPVREINNPAGWSEVSKCWVIDIRSPELMQLRRSLGLGEPKFPFHLTFAIRKKNALRKTASFIHFKQAAQATEIKASPIHGRGLFAAQDFSDGDVILPKLMTEAPSDDGRTRWEQSEEARFTNHSENPNTEVVREDGYVKMRASRDIKAGEELTASYDAASAHLGPGFYYTYRGKPYNGETDDDNQQDDSDTAVFGPSYQASHTICETLRSGAVGESEDEPRRKLAVDGRWHLPGGSGADRDGVRGEAGDRNGHRSHGEPGQSSILKLASEIKPVPNLAPQPSAEEADDEKKKLERAVNRNQRERTARRIAAAMDKVAADKCPGCGKPFPKGEPYPDVDMCEACERFGPPKLIKEGTDLVMQIAAARKVTQKPKSEAQAEAGNYPKGKVTMHGFQVVLENPKGSTRSGTDPSGKSWSVKMKTDYGYISRTEGKDGDHVDVFVGPHPDSEFVAVVDQVDPQTLKFDETKVMLGFTTLADAKEAYLSNYEDGWKGLGEITPVTMPQFKDWITNGNTKREFAKHARKTRQAKSAGVRRVADDEATLPQSASSEVRVLRSLGDQGMRKVANELLQLLRGHGSSAQGNDAGPGGPGGRLRTGQLSMGDVGRTTSQPSKQSLLRVPGSADDSAGLGGGTGDTVRYAPTKVAQLRMDSGESLYATTKLATAIKQQDADVSRSEQTSKDLGRGDGHRVSDAEDQTQQDGMERRASADHARSKEGSNSYYLNAINQTPMSWDTQKGVAQNLMQNLGQVKARGDRAIREAASYDRLQNAMDPDRASRQFLSYLNGERPAAVSHPLDRFVQEVSS